MVDDVERFAERYAESGTPAALAAELATLGTDYQASGYTTRDQANALGEALMLAPGRRLLDVGSGCGWPGLYLAGRHGCSVVSVDPVLDGSRITQERAVADGLAERSAAVQGDAESIPLRSRSVDAVVHGDLLC